MIDNKYKISIEKQCKLLGINRSSLYYLPKTESDENLEIMRLLGRQYFSNSILWLQKDMCLASKSELLCE